MMGWQPRLRPWAFAALGLIVIAAGLLGWWNAGREERAVPQGGAVTGEGAGAPPVPGEDGGPHRAEAGTGHRESPGAGGPVVHPRPVTVGTEAATGAMMVRGERLVFVAASGAATEVFRLPEGHAWASNVAPSPSAGAVAFVTRAEAGTGYLWVLHSDLAFSPHPLPPAIREPRAVTWAGEEAVLVGDPPHLFRVDAARWQRLPGDALAWPGTPSPGGRWAVYGAGPDGAGGAARRLYVYDLHRGEARAVETDGAAAYLGPWLDEGRLLVGLGEVPVAGGPAARTLAVLDVERQALAGVLPAAGDDGGWMLLGVSPDRRWAVAAPAARSGAARGPRRLVDLHGLASRPLPVAGAVLDAAWSAEDGRLYYLRPAGGAAVEVAALPVPGGAARVLGTIDPSPARITRLLGAAAGRLWLEIRDGEGVPALALWDVATGRLTTVPGE